jgi:hypothetical protein
MAETNEDITKMAIAASANASETTRAVLEDITYDFGLPLHVIANTVVRETTEQPAVTVEGEIRMVPIGISNKVVAVVGQEMQAEDAVGWGSLLDLFKGQAGAENLVTATSKMLALMPPEEFEKLGDLDGILYDVAKEMLEYYPLMWEKHVMRLKTGVEPGKERSVEVLLTIVSALGVDKIGAVRSARELSNRLQTMKRLVEAYEGKLP